MQKTIVVAAAVFLTGIGVCLAQPPGILSALAGAFLIGVVGGKWITNEADKRLLTKSVEVATTKALTKEKAHEIVSKSPMNVLKGVTQACENC